MNEQNLSQPNFTAAPPAQPADVVQSPASPVNPASPPEAPQNPAPIPNPVPSPVEPAATTPGQYVATLPPEVPANNPGKFEGIASIICAVASLLIFPPVFGTTGILLGLSAKKKGQDTLGLVGLILSAVFMVLGMILGIVSHTLLEAGLAQSSVGFLIAPFILIP